MLHQAWPTCVFAKFAVQVGPAKSKQLISSKILSNKVNFELSRMALWILRFSFHKTSNYLGIRIIYPYSDQPRRTCTKACWASWKLRVDLIIRNPGLSQGCMKWKGFVCWIPCLSDHSACQCTKAVGWWDEIRACSGMLLASYSENPVKNCRFLVCLHQNRKDLLWKHAQTPNRGQKSFFSRACDSVFVSPFTLPLLYS